MIGAFFRQLSAVDSKSVLFSFVFAVLLGLGCFYMGANTFMAYDHSESVRKEIVKLEKDIAEAHRKTDFVKAQKLRPVTEQEVDAIQAELMMSIKAHDVELKDYRANNDNIKKLMGKTYTMTLKGKYENVLNYILNFRPKTALVNILELEFKPENEGQMTAIMLYKIYLK